MMLLPVLVFAAVVHADEPNRTEHDLRQGTDIAAFRVITAEGLSPEASVAAWGEFMATWPQSPLAEVALERCLAQEADLDALLAPLSPVERNRLVQRYRAHRDHLVANPPEGAAVTDADPAADPPQTGRNMRRSSR